MVHYFCACWHKCILRTGYSSLKKCSCKPVYALKTIIYVHFCWLLQPMYEGWHKIWETGTASLPEADVGWLKNDLNNGLFQPLQSYKDTKGEWQRRFVLKLDRMWFTPPEVPGFIAKAPPSANSFFRSRAFFWRPVGVWKYSLKCTRPDCPAKDGKNFLNR